MQKFEKLKISPSATTIDVKILQAKPNLFGITITRMSFTNLSYNLLAKIVTWSFIVVWQELTFTFAEY